MDKDQFSRNKWIPITDFFLTMHFTYLNALARNTKEKDFWNKKKIL